MALTNAEELRLLQLEEAAAKSNPEGKGFIAGLGRAGAELASSVGRILPNSVRQSMEQKGYLPTERDLGSIRALPSDTSSKAGEIAFEVAATAAPGGGAAKGVQVLTKSLPYVRKLAPVAAGAAGGFTGAQVMNQDPVTGALAGGVLGPAMSAGGYLLKKPVEKVANWIGGAKDRVTTELQDLFGDRAVEAASALRNVRGYVPGEMPTSSAAATPRLVELKALEDEARNAPGANRLFERDAVNQAARLAAVERHAIPGRRQPVAGPGEPTMDSPLAVQRAAATDPLYAQADPNIVVMTPSLRETLNSVQVRVPRARAEQNFSQRRSNARAQGNTPPGKLPNQRDTGVPVAMRIDELQTVKNELSKQIKALEGSQEAATVMQRNNLVQARQMLDAEMKAQSPAYERASAEYSSQMKPQNQADVAEVLSRALTNQNEAETASRYLRAMEDAPRTIKNATGSKRFDRLDQVATPEQLADYRNVEASLLREQKVRQLGQVGGVVPTYEGALDKVAQIAPPIFDQTITMARRAVQNLAKAEDKEVIRILNEAVVDPQAMANLLERTALADRPALKAYLNVISKMTSPESIGAVSGTVGGSQ